MPLEPLVPVEPLVPELVSLRCDFALRCDDWSALVPVELPALEPVPSEPALPDDPALLPPVCPDSVDEPLLPPPADCAHTTPPNTKGSATAPTFIKRKTDRFMLTSRRLCGRVEEVQSPFQPRAHRRSARSPITKIARSPFLVVAL